MAHKIASKPRTMVVTPPIGWRKAIPLSVKLQVIINQRGLAPDNTPLDAMVVGIHFDHRPPLHEREYDPIQDETVPAANDTRFIVALPAPLPRIGLLRQITTGVNHETAGCGRYFEVLRAGIIWAQL